MVYTVDDFDSTRFGYYKNRLYTRYPLVRKTANVVSAVAEKVTERVADVVGSCLLKNGYVKIEAYDEEEERLIDERNFPPGYLSDNSDG